MVRWSEQKDQELRERRGISFKRTAQLYADGQYETVIKHPVRPNQQILIMRIDGYMWAVPFVFDEDGKTMFLKTAYPSRRLQREYGGGE